MSATANLQALEPRNIRALVAGSLLPGFAGSRLPDWVAGELKSGLAGVCLFGSNIESGTQLQELTSAIRRANPAAVIAIDEEGGDVTRLHYNTGSPHPGNAVLGRLDDPGMTFASAAAIGNELRRAGCTLDLAPSVDINSNPGNPVIGVRSFGDNAPLAASHAAAWVQGLQSTGVAACAKHFPGHGDTAQDSHLMLPTVEATPGVLAERELEPFKAAIAAGTASIMTSHILVPALDPDNPATFSTAILQGLLREQLGFTGVIVTDALDMKGASGGIGIPAAAVRALAAGCDLLCLGSDTGEAQFNAVITAVAEALRSGELPLRRVEEARTRSAGLLNLLPRDIRPAEELSGHPSGLPVNPARAAAAFRLNTRARKWLRSSAHPFELHQLSSTANQAVGSVPWGPASLEPDWNPAIAVRIVDPGHRLPAHRAGTRIALVGRNLHLHRQSMELISNLRRQDVDLIVVEMGWPSADPGIADACTFGASRLVSTALMQLLTGRLPQGVE
ncbi:glycoside hydrolase family 3 protein [Arthrobacter sp. Sa2BUA2]|uniref:Glycoside hydrolase family 3 protein n=1 Tax=Arthrobacter pullicola TaxID=2762224 RepID=A0ABR8YHG2_9MICC|nr:glycoside hydrolase family 3 protein [Arthrobacter pullicola]MBD8043654.1 glycoside hydrolase family 3 protein [Arthrobacter pullicola]